MKFAKYLLITTMLIFTASSHADTKLTQESVHRLIDSIQESVKQQDADKFAIYFTPDAKFTLDLPPNMGGRVKFKMYQYTELLREGWSSPMKSTYEVFDVKVVVDSGGLSATVTDLTVESLEMNGQKLETKSEETMKVILHDGKPKISELYGKMKL